MEVNDFFIYNLLVNPSLLAILHFTNEAFGTNFKDTLFCKVMKLTKDKIFTR